MRFLFLYLVRVIHPVSANVGGTDYVLYALNDVKASDIATALTLQIGTSGTFTYSIATYASRMYGEDTNLPLDPLGNMD